MTVSIMAGRATDPHNCHDDSRTDPYHRSQHVQEQQKRVGNHNRDLHVGSYTKNIGNCTNNPH